MSKNVDFTFLSEGYRQWIYNSRLTDVLERLRAVTTMTSGLHYFWGEVSNHSAFPFWSIPGSALGSK